MRLLFQQEMKAKVVTYKGKKPWERGCEFPSQHDEFVVQKSSILLNYRTPQDFLKVNLMILHHITQSKF